MEYRNPHLLPQVAAPVRGRLHAILAAASVTLLVLTELIVLDAALAWGTIGLWGLSPEIATAIGGVGALACCWAAYRMFRSAYAVERALRDHDFPESARRP